jgi:hypothetical protein
MDPLASPPREQPILPPGVEPPPPEAYPPFDPDVQSVIDKLALFVGRNGLAFEKTTKEKQKVGIMGFLWVTRY